ncbi:hypothetical protein FB451DRAFT_1172390 [Mycena latifolia]|nr:hypothetical protein FB451DRAFT_1172390 [Mycena latifolia]
MAAKTLFEECFNSSQGKIEDVMFVCLERLANTTRWGVTDFDWSSKWTVVYLAHSRNTYHKLDLHKALQFLGDIFLHNGDEETAHNLFVVALDGFTLMDVHRSRANCMIRLGDLAQRQGHLDDAVKLWHTARPLFELSLQAKDVAQIDARLGTLDQVHQKALAQLAIFNAPTEPFETPSVVENSKAEEPIQENKKQDMSPMTV